MKDFECKRCGECCSNILPLSEQDIKRIKKYGNKLKENKLLVDQNWYIRCPFLNSKNECDIYENRPDICRVYTCDKFINKKYDDNFLKVVKTKKYEVKNLRKEFFN